MSMPATFRAAAVAAAALSATAVFADTANLTVTANVPAVCRLVTVPGMNFGTLDQVAEPEVNTTSVLQYKCTNGTAPTALTVGGVASPFSGNLDSAGNLIAYTISWTNPTTAGSGLGAAAAAIDLTLNGQIPAGTYGTKPAGTYQQIVQLVLTP